MGNSAIITLACPACGRAFLSLADTPGGDEICPHCTRAAPRSAFRARAAPDTAQMFAAAEEPSVSPAFVIEARPFPVAQQVVSKTAPLPSQPQIPADSPVDVFLRSQLGREALPHDSASTGAPAPPVFDGASVAPLWPGLGLEVSAPIQTKADAVVPTGGRHRVFTLAILATLLIAAELAWQTWGARGVVLVQPVEKPKAPEPVTKTAAAGAEPAPIIEERRALPADGAAR